MSTLGRYNCTNPFSLRFIYEGLCEDDDLCDSDTGGDLSNYAS
jgi:hypothetical protein